MVLVAVRERRTGAGLATEPAEKRRGVVALIALVAISCGHSVRTMVPRASKAIRPREETGRRKADPGQRVGAEKLTLVSWPQGKRGSGMGSLVLSLVRASLKERGVEKGCG